MAAIPVGIRWGLWLAGSGLPTKDSGFGLPLRGPGGVLGGMVAGVAWRAGRGYGEERRVGAGF